MLIPDRQLHEPDHWHVKPVARPDRGVQDEGGYDDDLELLRESIRRHSTRDIHRHCLADTVTGTVTFTQTSPTATLCTAVPLVLVSGQLQASCNTTYNSADASIPVTATYSGDNSNASSSNSPLTQVVNKANTTASTPTSSYNPSPFGQSVTYSTTVTIDAPGTGSLAEARGALPSETADFPARPSSAP